MGRDRLVARRLASGLTVEDLASRLGVTVRTLRRWESGECTPQPLQRRPLAEALGVTSAELAAMLRPNPQARATGPGRDRGALLSGWGAPWPPGRFRPSAPAG